MSHQVKALYVVLPLLFTGCGGEGPGTVGVPDGWEDGSTDAPVADGGSEATVETQVEAVRPPEAAELPPGLDVGPGPGDPGYPCQTHQDCFSGWCISTADGKLCTVQCQEECPLDWKCALHKPSLPDEIYLCTPAFLRLCRPCLSNADCMLNGISLGDACLPYGEAGNFCGAACDGLTPCPQGYACQEAEDLAGGLTDQCVLEQGECLCLQWYAEEGAATTCYQANDFGTCEGERHCSATGLTDCSAAEPIPEQCNAVDDDCDQAIDEDTSGAECLVINGVGTCPGTYECDNGQLHCEGEEAKPEICDGVDSDCDGATDDGFPDSDGDGIADCLETDKDGDGIVDGKDNCPEAFNPTQADLDLDALGDPCDPDDDNDKSADDVDCAPQDADSHPGGEESCDGKDNDCNFMVDEGFTDSDGDGWKDCADDDDDGDGTPDVQDCLPLDANAYPGGAEECDGKDNDCDFQADEGFPDTDQDGKADCADPDLDGDGKDNPADNCPEVANPEQTDLDSDKLGDACDIDQDGDAIPNAVDNCSATKNPSQADVDSDSLGDACDPDADGDGLDNAADNCPLVANPDQKDVDEDSVGDACEEDADGDGTPNGFDCAPGDAAVHPGAKELCDGLDNDCDAVVDETFSDADKDGLKDCFDPDDDDDGDPDQSDCAPLDPKIHQQADELCDGLDNNCNGKADEGLGTLSCGKGECAHKVPACLAGEPMLCDPFEGAAKEACDGKDNDCNGLTDEGLGAASCGLGICQHTTPACAGGKPGLCDPFEAAAEELCDGLDNDCDGKTDEQLGKLTCGKGICLHSVAACIGGEAQECDPFEGALPESCNGLDDNCNGQADEELGTTSCGKGVCAHSVPYCQDGKVAVCDPFDGVALEACDGLDNDCDGLTDEELGTTACGLGICQHVVPNCLNGQPHVCNPLQNAAPEICDGTDNDCNGAVDDGLGKTTCGEGICQHTVANCFSGLPQECDPMAGWLQETCNGLDDDCDGEADEELGSTTCGQGICLHVADNCKDGLPQVCDPMEGAGQEDCNGLDDDCDGPVDEEMGTTTCGQGECLHTVDNCKEGKPVPCDPLAGAAAETCDDKDNDCDGEVDDDFAFTVVEAACRTVKVKNTGAVTLKSWTVKAGGLALPLTVPDGGIPAGQTDTLRLAYTLDGKVTLTVASECKSLQLPFDKECAVRMAMVNYGDMGGDHGAVYRTVADLADEFLAATGLDAYTPTENVAYCSLAVQPHWVAAETEDLSAYDLLYYHNHGTFSFALAVQQKLYDFVKTGGMLIFDDCGGADYVDLKDVFGIYISYNGGTSGGYSFVLDSDAYKYPFPMNAGDFDTAATWTEGGQGDYQGGVQTIITRGPSPLLSGVKVGHGWIAFMGGDWGCSLSSECDSGNTPAHKLMMNFAWIASGRGKLIK